MRLLLLAAPLCLLAASACAPSRPRTSELSAAALNRRLADRHVRVVPRDRVPQEAVGFRVEADSASWIDANSGHVTVMAITDILRVESFSRRRGAKRGARYGALTGAIVGFAVGLWVGHEARLLVEAVGGGVLGRAYWAMYAAGNYAAVGAGAGALVGVLVGDRDVYALPDPETAAAGEPRAAARNAPP